MLGADTQKDSETRQGAETMDIAYATCGREQPVHEPGKTRRGRAMMATMRAECRVQSSAEADGWEIDD